MQQLSTSSMIRRNSILGGWLVFFVLAGYATNAWADSARYLARFEADWSRQSHPDAYSTGAHFSGLIGGTHNSSVVFWESGGTATPGIRSMAETGSKFLMTREVNDAISAGHAGVVISGPGTGSPGVAEVEFETDSNFPLVTLVAMIAPSPDWFVGVGGLSLREDGRWLDEVVVDLNPYDAGTDSGLTFTAANQRTSPQGVISRILEAPFYERQVLGTFTFRRVDSPEVEFLRGDCNDDSGIDIADALCTLAFLFDDVPAPTCVAALNHNGDTSVDISDAVAVLLYLFASGSPPAPPFPACGAGSLESDGTIGCETPPENCA